MTAVEGKAVADLVNRAGQLAKRLAPAAPTVSAEEAKRMPLEELLVTVRDLAAKLQPGATEPVVDPKASPESVPDLSAEPAAGPGVARVLELLQREEPAA